MFNTYEDLIEYVKTQKRSKGDGNYYESHHIIPHNLGGRDTEDNLVLLTVSEHVQAHYLIALREKSKDNLRGYVANIQSADLIIHGASIFAPEKEKEIKAWLEDPDAQKLAESIKIKYTEARKMIPGANGGKSIKDGTMKPRKPRIWAHITTQKPVHILLENIGLKSWEGYERILDCPICHKANSYESFACCPEHEAQYLKQIKDEFRAKRAQQTKESWKDPELTSRRKEALKGITSTLGKVWVNKGNKDTFIDMDDLDRYLSDGWSKGRIHGTGHAQSEEARKNISEAKKDMCYISNDTVAAKAVPLSELDTYLANGWTRGRRDGTSRKGIKQPPMAWVNKDGEFKKIRQADLEKYYAEGWKRGRTS